MRGWESRHNLTLCQLLARLELLVSKVRMSHILCGSRRSDKARSSCILSALATVFKISPECACDAGPHRRPADDVTRDMHALSTHYGTGLDKKISASLSWCHYHPSKVAGNARDLLRSRTPRTTNHKQDQEEYNPINQWCPGA